MKITSILISAIIAVLAFGTCASASEGDINTVVTAVYWDGRLNFGSEKTAQRHLPALAAQINFNETWSANVEYSNGRESTTEPTGYSFDSSYALVGMQYMFQEEYFVTFSWQRIEYNLAGGVLPFGMDFSGVRLGAGYDFTKWLAEDWTGHVEFGVGITNNVEVAYTNGIAKEDSDTVDGKVEVRYRMLKNVEAVGGYKYMKTRANVLAVPYSFDVKGAYLGLGYQF